jgi:hypothetical protein
MTDLFGVDLSENQTVTDYGKLNAAIDFAYLRVFRSNGLQDKKWRAFYDGITKPKAPYLFLRPVSQQSFASQMQTFWGWASDVAWQWGPVLDCEYAGITGAQIKAAIAACRTVTGMHTVYVYVGRGDLVGAAKPETFVTDTGVRLIAARYFANNRASAWTNLGFDHSQLDVTQFWNNGRVPGIAGAVDLNTARRITGLATSVVKEEDDMALTDMLPPVKLADGKEYTLSVGDILRGMAQYIAGDVAEGAGTTGHPEGQYVSRIVSLSDIDAGVKALAAKPASLSLSADQLATLTAAVGPAIKDAVDGLGLTGVSDADKTAIAEATAALLGARLEGTAE